MQLESRKEGSILIVKAIGRLDASWSDWFAEYFSELIRQGDHSLIIDAEDISFLSSAGIRSLIRINKELMKVKGTLHLVNPAEFVRNTLTMTGLAGWILEELPVSVSDEIQEEVPEKLPEGWYLLDKLASARLRIFDGWHPFEALSSESSKKISFSQNTYSIGIGSPLTSESSGVAQYGDFLAAAGHLVYQNPDERSRPDFLIPAGNFLPEMESIQAIIANGSFSHHYRFKPTDEKSVFSLSQLATEALERVQSAQALVVILAEIDGLVGSRLIQSPSLLTESSRIDFPEIRNWLNFSGERAYSNEQALVVGIVMKATDSQEFPLVKPLIFAPGLLGHFHAAVFPYQALPNGLLDAPAQIEKFFNGPPPRNVYHLLEDSRPVTGIGESAFIRGALWCAPIAEKEVLV